MLKAERKDGLTSAIGHVFLSMVCLYLPNLTMPPFYHCMYWMYERVSGWGGGLQMLLQRPVFGHTHLECSQQLQDQKFDVYIEFCSNQKPAIEVYSTQKAQNSHFAAVMAQCEAKIEESGGFDLPSFLLKGMQRLLKYQPLLENALRATSPEKEIEVQNLQNAIQLMEV